MANDKKEVVGRITLLNVRLSFADIWRPKSLQRNDGTQSDPKFSANALIPKDGKDPVTGKDMMAKYNGRVMPIMKALKKAKMDAMGKKLGETEAGKAKVKPQNYCIKDGDLENYDGYADMWFISCNNSKQPGIVGKDKRKLSEADGIPYSGCYVNLVATLWCQLPGKTPNGDPKPLAVYGSLEALQYAAPGEAFGAKPVDTDDAFDDITDDDDEIGDDDDGDDDDDDLL